MLFGTDGIRGEVVDSPSDDEEAISQLLDERMISARLMRVVGEALTRVAGMDNTVVIGWDDRPRNGELVAALTVGLHLGGCKVIHTGICATPGLHNSLFETNSSLGCMITASHNPVSDSGIKVFDSNGFKTNTCPATPAKRKTNTILLRYQVCACVFCTKLCIERFERSAIGGDLARAEPRAPIRSMPVRITAASCADA